MDHNLPISIMSSCLLLSRCPAWLGQGDLMAMERERERWFDPTKYSEMLNFAVSLTKITPQLKVDLCHPFNQLAVRISMYIYIYLSLSLSDIVDLYIYIYV